MIDRISHGPVMELRLNRPPANALNHELIRALDIAIHEAPAEGARALVLSGQPGMFCAGLDVPSLMGRDVAAMDEFFRAFFRLLKTIAASSIPIAAALTGHAPAGGTVMAVFCDRRVMSEGSYKLGLNEHRVALPIPRPVMLAFERLCGPRVASDYGLRGALMEADEALRIGLVDELVPAEQVIERAVAWATEMTALPSPMALAETRRYQRADVLQAFELLDTDVAAFSRIWFSEETQAVMNGLIERLQNRG